MTPPINNNLNAPAPEPTEQYPTPQFLSMQSNPDAVTVNDLYVIVPDGKVFLCAGIRFTDLQSSNDYAYGDTPQQAFERYEAAFRDRNKQELIELFIELDKQLTIAKKIYQDYDDAVLLMEKMFGLNSHFQDKEGTVYQIAVQEWLQVKMKPVTINRTRREGEKKGTLSMTAARELGYIVEGEGKKEPKQNKIPVDVEGVEAAVTIVKYPYSRRPSQDGSTQSLKDWLAPSNEPELTDAPNRSDQEPQTISSDEVGALKDIGLDTE